MKENKEVPEIKLINRSDKAIIFLVVICLALIIGVGYYYQEKANCYNDKDLDDSYLNGTIDTVNYISFQLINQSSYCNQIPIQWIDQNNQTYNEILISINCLEGND